MIFKSLGNMILIASLQSAALAAPIKSYSDNILDLSLLKKQNENIVFTIKEANTGKVSYTSDPIFYKKNNYFYQGSNRLQGYPTHFFAKACELEDVKATNKVMEGRDTTLIDLIMTLDRHSTIPAIAFTRNNPSSYNTHENIAFYHAGKKTYIDIYFVKNDENMWYAYIYNADHQVIGSGKLLFSDNGNLAGFIGFDELHYDPLHSNSAFSIAMYHTYLREQFGLLYQDQNGYADGEVAKENIDEMGNFGEVYSNGKEMQTFKIAVSESTH